jgi:hypothetical protein
MLRSWPGPAIHEIAARRQEVDTPTISDGWVHLVTNRPNGTLYAGVTDNNRAKNLGASGRFGRRIH